MSIAVVVVLALVVVALVAGIVVVVTLASRFSRRMERLEGHVAAVRRESICTRVIEETCLWGHDVPHREQQH